MKPEFLESLLIDRALGELSPEVDALLAAHLATAPAAAREAGRLAATLRQARRAVATPLAAPRRPLGIGRLHAELKKQQWRAWAGEGLRLAACLALGLALGWMGHVGRRTAPALAATNAPPATAPVARDAGDFWSLDRIAAAGSRRPPPSGGAADRYHLRWSSPVKMPAVEDNL